MEVTVPLLFARQNIKNVQSILKIHTYVRKTDATLKKKQNILGVNYLCIVRRYILSSVMDPNPVGSETFKGSASGKIIPDFSTKLLNLKILIPFYQNKNFSKS